MEWQNYPALDSSAVPSSWTIVGSESLPNELGFGHWDLAIVPPWILPGLPDRQFAIVAAVWPVNDRYLVCAGDSAAPQLLHDRNLIADRIFQDLFQGALGNAVPNMTFRSPYDPNSTLSQSCSIEFRHFPSDVIRRALGAQQQLSYIDLHLNGLSVVDEVMIANSESLRDQHKVEIIERYFRSVAENLHAKRLRKPENWSDAYFEFYVAETNRSGLTVNRAALTRSFVGRNFDVSGVIDTEFLRTAGLYNPEEDNSPGNTPCTDPNQCRCTDNSCKAECCKNRFVVE